MTAPIHASECRELTGTTARDLQLRGLHTLSSGDPENTLALVRFLREASSAGVFVRWSCDGVDIDVESLVHLPPPEAVGAESSEADSLAAWHRRYRPGLCFYRRGPRFVILKDTRCRGGAARMVLEGDDDIAAFETLHCVVDLNQLDGAALELFEVLDAEHLVLRLGGHATLLPNRMHRWPVPALDV